MNKLLLIIDVQNDFVNDITRPYVSKISELIDSLDYENIAFTRFVNDSESIWFRKLNYKRCMTEDGKRIVIDTLDYPVFDKRGYSSLTDEFRKYIKDTEIDEIYLCGFDTDACVQKTAIDLFENGYEVFVLKDYCMSHAGIELHNVIINNLGRLIGRDRVI